MPPIIYPNATFVLGSNVSLSNLYQQVKSSVVVIQDLVPVTSFFGTLVTMNSRVQDS